MSSPGAAPFSPLPTIRRLQTYSLDDFLRQAPSFLRKGVSIPERRRPLPSCWAVYKPFRFRARRTSVSNPKRLNSHAKRAFLGGFLRRWRRCNHFLFPSFEGAVASDASLPDAAKIFFLRPAKIAYVLFPAVLCRAGPACASYCATPFFHLCDLLRPPFFFFSPSRPPPSFVFVFS